MKKFFKRNTSRDNYKHFRYFKLNKLLLILSFFLISLGTQYSQAQTLIEAARDGNLARVTELLSDDSVDVNHQDSSGSTALILALATKNGHNESLGLESLGLESLRLETLKRRKIVRALIAAGADLNLSNNDGDTALIWAIRNAYFVIGRDLIAAGVDTNPSSNNGWMAFIQAFIESEAYRVPMIIN